MPQLDIVIFFNQFLWFFGVFPGIYSFIAYIIVPKINFYYFARYNIQTVLLRFENSLQLGALERDASAQVINELDFVYLHRLWWFALILPNLFLIQYNNSTNDEFISTMACMQNQIIVFFLLETGAEIVESKYSSYSN